MAAHLLGKLEESQNPHAGLLEADLQYHTRDENIVYVHEAGPEGAFAYGAYFSALRSGLGAGMLSQTANYGRGFFEGEKAFVSNGKAYLPHPDDNNERFREGAGRLGYCFDYSNEKLNYLKILALGLNGYLLDWPQVEGKPAAVVYIRPLNYFQLNTRIRLGGPHYNNVAIIPEPMGSYFSDKTRDIGVNVLVYDSPINQAFALDPALSLKNNSNYEWASYLRNLARQLPATAETIKFTGGFMKEGSADSVGVIQGDTVVFSPLSTGRLNGITALFVQETLPKAGGKTRLEQVPLFDFLSSDGIILLGNAVNYMGVGRVMVPEEYLQKYLDGEQREKARPAGFEEHEIEGKMVRMAIFDFGTLSNPVFLKVKAAFENHLAEYSLCINDVLVPDAAEKMKILGERMLGAVPKNSLNSVFLPLPNYLRDGAALVLEKRLWPSPGKREAQTAWSGGLQAAAARQARVLKA